MTSVSVWIVGSGPMAQEYARVLAALDVSFRVVGRGHTSAAKFKSNTGYRVFVGGVDHAVSQLGVPEFAIVAVGVEALAKVASKLIVAGTKQILLEKPGGLTIDEIEALNQLANNYGANIIIAYNRRYYESVSQAEEIIESDGGLISMNFEFTEWSAKIAALKKPLEVKNNWLLGNSSHVIDLAFYFAGTPDDWSSWNAGSISWHPISARFCGAGVTSKGVLFSYCSDWEAPGRWGIELFTRKSRLILRPLERLQRIKHGSFSVESIDDNSDVDSDYKAGLYNQTKAFMEADFGKACLLENQVQNVALYSLMAGYR